MSEQYGVWITNKCGHAAHKIDVNVMEDLEDDITFTVTARNCQREDSASYATLICKTCGEVVADYDPVLCETFHEEAPKFQSIPKQN